VAVEVSAHLASGWIQFCPICVLPGVDATPRVPNWVIYPSNPFQREDGPDTPRKLGGAASSRPMNFPVPVHFGFPTPSNTSSSGRRMNGRLRRMARPLSQRSSPARPAAVSPKLATYDPVTVTLMKLPMVSDHRAGNLAAGGTAGLGFVRTALSSYLTAAFGVAASGHANPAVVRAGQRQMGRLLHAMGDVHPHALKAELARELSRITFERWSDVPRILGKVLLGSSGFEAVEAALKTAMLATGKPRVLAFARRVPTAWGYGALNVTHRAHFRSPSAAQLRDFADFVPFPTQPDALAGILRQVERRLKAGRIGAILTEPVQARGGHSCAAPGFPAGLRRLCDRQRRPFDSR